MAMKTIRDRIQFIKQDQQRILLEQKEENRKQVTSTITSITVGSLLATILLVTCLNLYVRNSLKRSQVEDEVRHLNTTLEGKLHEIEVVNKELESFSYSVSHDLRAPLRAMAGFSNILIEDYEDKLDEAGREYLRRIISASDRMARLIDGILDLSRISRRQVRREEVNLSEIAEQVVYEMRVAEPERVVDVAIEPGMVARGDTDLVGAILQNLFANAWKFTSKKPSAHITFGSMDRDGKKVFYVRDDGAGFDMAYIEKLFGTFQRLHTEEDFKGTGVGLATVRRIAHLHGGEVWAEGAVGQGATFYFTLGT
jgi:light-regulated signal transduction histidine kinase (bacteriophytochrome)